MRKACVWVVTLMLLWAVAGAGAVVDAQVRHVSIGGAGTAGTFYIIAAGVAELLRNELGVQATAEVTGGSVENARRMASGEMELAIMQPDVADQARRGDGFTPVDMVAVAPMYPNIQQIVVLADSDIQSVGDLKGKRVSVGSPGSGILATNQLFFEVLGMTLDDMSPRYLSFAENVIAFRDGQIDAALVNTAAPSPWILDLQTSHDLRYIALSDEEVQAVLDQYPYFVADQIPAGTYRGQDEPVPTFSAWIMLVTRADMPEDFIYNVTKTVMENREHLMAIHSAAQNITVDNVSKVSIPFHPGAARYYREQGVEVPH